MLIVAYQLPSPPPPSHALCPFWLHAGGRSSPSSTAPRSVMHFFGQAPSARSRFLCMREYSNMHYRQLCFSSNQLVFLRARKEERRSSQRQVTLTPSLYLAAFWEPATMYSSGLMDLPITGTSLLTMDGLYELRLSPALETEVLEHLVTVWGRTRYKQSMQHRAGSRPCHFLVGPFYLPACIDAYQLQLQPAVCRLFQRAVPSPVRQEDPPLHLFTRRRVVPLVL